MTYPLHRMRRLRENEHLRNMIQETRLHLNDLIMPLFVVEGLTHKVEIPSMPGCYRFSVSELVEECHHLYNLGIQAVILFGVPEKKDEEGSEAWSDTGIVQKAISAIKKAVPHLFVIGDVCLCEYTSHGHCGMIDNGKILNDPTLDLLARTAVSQARAGADMVAPSDMMDGRIQKIRRTLDREDFTTVPIMSYAAKYASAYYGPFRDAAGSAPQFGDRRSYQMNPANSREAMREIEMDIEEGADIVMVKPALAYLDILSQARRLFNLPLAAYNVSGEYSMIKAAADKGWLDEKKIVMETLLSMKRAGANLILTYFARDAAEWLKDG
jgi:porphobilinogen synthase